MKVVVIVYVGDIIIFIGIILRWGVIVVDLCVILYGIKVYIFKLGMIFVVEDCGGVIKGNRIDIFMNSEGKVLNWGRKSIDIYLY